jgi:beta-lactamase class A
MRHLIAGLLLSCVGIIAPAGAQSRSEATIKADPALEHRILEVRSLLAGTEGDPTATFSPDFLAQVPASSVAALAKQLRDAFGAVGAVEQVTAVSPWQARFRLRYEKAIAPVEIAVAPAEPHQITQLLIRPPVTLQAPRTEASVEAVAATLAALPGKAGILFARLDKDGPLPLAAANADQAFAIGSEFKLVILAELVRAITAGERRWDDMVTLDGTPLPGGLYAQRPPGTAVSLRELAGRMISVSDNSATDILLRRLGREKVEAMLSTVGIARPEGMRPFLGTLEAFKLKGVDGGALGQRWTAADEAGRRTLLAEAVARTPSSAIDEKLFATGKPLQIEAVEWFASPADMVRVMDWLRHHTESGPAAEARALLAQNPGVGREAAARWQYLGYKGGSEPGVIAMTFLLQAKGGDWYAMSASWNDPAAVVDDARFAALMTRAVEVAAQR